MKIYGSTQYFDRDKETETYYQLSVISKWDYCGIASQKDIIKLELLEKLISGEKS